MAPKTPSKKPNTNKDAKKNGETTAKGPVDHIDYAEVQSDEIEVLKAIYMDDFEEIETKTAWSRTTDRCFKLQLRAPSDEASVVELTVKLTATYPRTAPILEISQLRSFHDRTQKRIHHILETRPKQLLGEVMIHEICGEIQDALEDAVLARQQGTVPSLAVMNQQAEQAASVLAQQAEEERLRQQQEAEEEEQRMLQQMVDEELKREKRKPSKSISQTTTSTSFNLSDAEIISFDQPANIAIGNESRSFTAVTVLREISHQKHEQTSLATPRIAADGQTPLVLVKRMILKEEREHIMELEKLLEQARRLNHDGILNLLAFRVDRIDNMSSQLVLCSEYADRGSLQGMLELSTLHASKARQFTVELLEALDYLHRNGVAHGNISCKTIQISSSPSVSPVLADFGFAWLLPTNSDSLPGKWRAPEGSSVAVSTRRKSDVWDLGIVMLQMFMSLHIIHEFASPHVMLARLDISDAFDDLAKKFFTIDARKRPSAFDLLPAEFLRTEASVMDTETLAVPSRGHFRQSTGGMSPAARRSRHNSSNAMDPMSRYATDFTEIGRLGKGGFGEVVKARNKLDGGVYAVKKIRQTQQLLDHVLSEVMLLNRLNHPYVVRYFSTWVENDLSGSMLEDTSSATDGTRGTVEPEDSDTSSDGPRMDFGYQSTGGLDFVSSSGYPNIEFGDDEDDDDDDDSSDDDTAEHNGTSLITGESAMDSDENSLDDKLKLRKSRSDSRRMLSILYIQMEYCERQTLRDLVRRGMSTDDSWRFVRQITEGLAHVHSHGIIHRDLKPDNIFIDLAGNPKIGDFGLATTSQYQAAGRMALMSGASGGGDMTRSVGTALYVAPELRSTSGTSYSDKVDMYSLGIIFFEMSELFSTAMERIRAIQEVREKGHELPDKFRDNGDKAAQGKLIECLISHKPSERPSSTELLRSDILPLKIEDETIRQALSGLSDPRSPYHQKMMSALFAHDTASNHRVKALAWDAKSNITLDDAARMRFRGAAKSTLAAIFRRHGAEEARREGIFPRSSYYTNANVVQVLDGSGNLLQLPYDLILPHARQLARHVPEVKRLFSFGSAYRDAFTGGPPYANDEVDFDIVNSGPDEEIAWDDAELLKVADEIFNELPYFTSHHTTCFHINHAGILNSILEHCRVPLVQQVAVKETLSRLGFQWNWSKVRGELRRFGLADTTLEDLSHFDIRDKPDKVFNRLEISFEHANTRMRSKLADGIRSLSALVKTVSNLSMKSKIYVTPLGCVNAKFYDDGLLFQCVIEKKSNRTVIAAGGRYDSLIQAHRPVDGRVGCRGAVGISIGLDRIVAMMKNTHDQSRGNFVKAKSQNITDQPLRRCDVLVAAPGDDGARLVGVKIIDALWTNGVGAELARGTSMDESEYSFVVTIRHEASQTVRFRTVGAETEEGDVPITSLVSHVQQEMREREHNKAKQPAIIRHSSQQDVDRRANVHVLMAQHRSKKSNKYHIVEAAQQRWAEKVDEWKDAPILAIETRDDVLDLLRDTRLGDVETWRKAIQSVQLNERQYLGQVQDTLNSWRQTWLDGNGRREACVFNFRTGHCIYYDLGT